MPWDLKEAISHYNALGAPGDQSALIGLLREVQQEHGGSIPGFLPAVIADALAVKESLILAIIKRIPSLRLGNQHQLEICAGPNCGKHAQLAEYAERIHLASGKKFAIKFTPCMRICGKGPNVKWDGVLYHKATPALLEQFLKDVQIEF